MTTLEDHKIIQEILRLDTKAIYTQQKLIRKPSSALKLILQELNDARIQHEARQVQLHNVGHVSAPHLGPRRGHDDDDDDETRARREETETQPDMSAFQGTKAKQQFTLFEQRKVDIVNYLHAIRINTQTLEQFRNKLEPAMLTLYEDNIKLDRQRVDQFITEIRAIYTWFKDMKEAKAEVFRALSQRSIDTEGRIEQAFGSQVKEIEEYTKLIEDYLRP